MAERDYYVPIRDRLETLFKAKVNEVYLEITADGRFTNRLKHRIPNHREILFHLLRGKDVAPDITGFIEGSYVAKFIVVEVKDKPLKVDHVYQTKKYAELFDAYFAFLVSTCEIPEEMRRLSEKIIPLLTHSSSRQVTLVSYAGGTAKFHGWHRENPFENEYWWR